MSKYIDESEEKLSKDQKKSTLGDGIPDDWKINGFTIENDIIVKWNEEEHKKKGYTKYFSDPNDPYPCGDPYNYIEKTLGNFSGLEEARNPLVAAFPVISVELEEIIISQNITTTTENQSGTTKKKSTAIKKSTNSEHTNSLSISSSTEKKIISSFGRGIDRSISANTSNTFSSTNSIDTNLEDGLKSMNVNSTLLNNAEAAFLNANVRYVNLGTAPIYNLKPTLNFAIPKYDEIGMDTIATISAKSNTVANVVLPGEKYPNASQNAISWNTIDDFNSQPIKLNYDQAKKIIDGVPIIVETLQVSGEYEIIFNKKSHLLSDVSRWEFITPDIYRKTASITLKLDNGETYHRRVAANKFNSNERKIPQLTIKEALEIAFSGLKFNENNESISFKNTVINDENIRITYDDFTDSILDAQKELFKEKNELKNSIFDLFLTQEMNIIIEQIKDKDKNISLWGKTKRNLLKLSDNKKLKLNLRELISIEDLTELNSKKLAVIIKEYLINCGLPMKWVQKLDFEIQNTYKIDTPEYKYYYKRLENIFDSNLISFKVKTKNEETEINNVYCIEYAIRDKVTLDLIKNKLSKIIDIFAESKNNFNQHNETDFDMNFLISNDTDLGKNFYRLKEIIKTYLVVAKKFPYWFIKKINIEINSVYDPNKSWDAKFQTFKEAGIDFDNDNIFHKGLRITWKYENQQITENVMIFRNVRKSNTTISKVFPKGFENWFSDAMNEKENLSYNKMLELAKIFEFTK